jgi:hypothetical protein
MPGFSTNVLIRWIPSAISVVVVSMVVLLGSVLGQSGNE